MPSTTCIIFHATAYLDQPILPSTVEVEEEPSRMSPQSWYSRQLIVGWRQWRETKLYISIEHQTHRRRSQVAPSTEWPIMRTRFPRAMDSTC